MDILKEYILQNWILVLVLMAFAIMLFITVFLNKKTKTRLFILIGVIFLLSISVFFEFYYFDRNRYPNLRLVLVAIRYSTVPFIIALILLAVVKQKLWYILVPAIASATINFISIFTGIVFSVDSDGNLIRGIFGYLPYIVIGGYCIVLVYVLVKQSRQLIDIIPIVFLAFSFLTGLIFPLVIGRDYSKIFCSTIAVAVFVYYVFLILQLTKKDALTGLLNRQAYYSEMRNNYKDITSVVSIDMNGLKRINDTLGHQAGDEAIITVSDCFMKVTKAKQLVYRIGGDEFIILCKKTTEEELMSLVSHIRKSVSETNYSVSIGYCYNNLQDKNLEEMIKYSDLMMYKDKEEYYAKNPK